MSSKLLIAFYLAAGALAFLIIVWMKRKPSEEETREVKNLAVKLPHFHHTGAFISAGVVAVTLVYLAFSNYSIGTTRQWWLLDMFDARHVNPQEFGRLGRTHELRLWVDFWQHCPLYERFARF